jgi:hypothetical protein
MESTVDAGFNSKGKEVQNLSQAINQEMKKGQTPDDWYKVSVAYWNKQPANFKGMLGGYDKIDDPDIKYSEELF